MTPTLDWNNSLNWALQVTAISFFAYLATVVFRMQSANMRLRWYQLALGVVLLLPALVPPVQNTIVVEENTLGVVTAVMGQMRTAPQRISWITVAMEILGGGVLMRLMWLFGGFFRLREHLRASEPLHPPSSWQTEADIRICANVSGPVTFGFFNPVILLPPSYQALGETQQDAIVCHEVMHIRRGDWLWMLGEELVRSILWFHPAIWWLTAEIRLAREQAVDAEVVSMMQTRDEYVDALLTFANVVPTPFAGPVAEFIRRRHLKQRVIHILKEVHMSRTRTISTALVATAAMAAVAWFTTTALPLRAQPQVVADSPGVKVSTNGAELQHRIPMAYPRAADGTQVAGTVVAEVRMDGSGNVTDAQILSGPDELRKSVLQSVLNWHFAKSAGTVQQVSVTFQPQAAPIVANAMVPAANVQLPGAGPASGPPPPPSPFLGDRVISQIDVQGLPEQAKQELVASLPVHPGDAMTPEAAQKLLATAKKYDEHLGLSMRGKGANEITVTLAPQGATRVMVQLPVDSASAVPGQVRVGGNVAQANLISQQKPIYPPLAKAARVQGTVKFEVVIDKEGKISNLHLISGPPLLVQAAMEAVQKWVYKPTLLNGNPVEVITTIDVNFTLSPDVPAVPAPPQ